MGRDYFDDVLDIAIKHAGRDILCDMALESPPAAEEAQFSADFEKRMARIIGREARKNKTKKAAKTAVRAAMGLLIVLFVSTAVVFSSEALRTKVFNMFTSIGEDSVDIGAEADPEGIPEGMIVPGYIPEGFRLAEAKKASGATYLGRYTDSLGSIITIRQVEAQNVSITADNDGSAYETDISGIKALVSDNDDNSIVSFICKEYAFTVTAYGEVETQQLIKIAQSIIERLK